MKKAIRFCCILLTALTLFTGAFPGCAVTENTPDIVVGIAWRPDLDSELYTNVTAALDDMNIAYVPLAQVTLEGIPYAGAQVADECRAKEGYLLQEYADRVKADSFEESNVASVMENIDGVILTGGEDISPTLFKIPEAWHGIKEETDYNATKDVSDYILTSYCIERDIPVLGICRGLQMIGICCGATVIQDIPAWFESQGIQYDNTHRNVKTAPNAYCDYAPHAVEITDRDSVLYAAIGDTVLEGAPSWHHQNILSVDGTGLKVTGVTRTCGRDIIEAVQHRDKTFVVGVQFHLEAAAARHIHGAENASLYMPVEQAEKFFALLYEAMAAKSKAA